MAIVFACEKFDAYIYGRDSVRVQTDHKPLESIFRKELCVAPKRLQRMLLRLQKYDLDVTYLKGELMLSRAHLPQVDASVSVRDSLGLVVSFKMAGLKESQMFLSVCDPTLTCVTS